MMTPTPTAKTDEISAVKGAQAPAAAKTGTLEGRELTYYESVEAAEAAGCICADGMHGCCCCWSIG